ncbi:MAG: hypothetical protein AAGJ46_03510 [Planctomycetota bacterium]
MRFTKTAAAYLTIVVAGAAQASVIIPPTEDVMTSAFFQGANRVRGFAGETPPRAVHRVSIDNAFGVGPETVYIAFDPSAFGGFTSPVQRAVLTASSTSGGFFADAGPGNPFIVSAHGVSADPFTSITDDTNPGGPLSFVDFFEANILDAAPPARIPVASFGEIEFNVTALVNDWLDGTTTDFVIALTGKNDRQLTDFLHGFVNNSETPGSTFLTVSQVPEPSSVILTVAAALAASWWVVRPIRHTNHAN